MSAEPQAPFKLAAHETDIEALLARIPFAGFIGMEALRLGKELTFVLRFRPHIIGNPVLPALHGGVIGAFLETACLLELIWDVALDKLPKPIDISIDYLRSGRPVDTYARAIITKRGRRVANVRAEAWQDERVRPIATLHGHFKVSPNEAAAMASRQ